MSTLETTEMWVPESVAGHPVPDRDESMTGLAWPTIGIYVAALTVFVFSTLAALGGFAPIWVTIPLNAAVTFVMFTVVHDATHNAVSSTRWVNALFGRLAWVFIAPAISFPSFAFIHIEHHRHTNDVENDPNLFSSHAPIWQAPYRWALADVFYSYYFLRRVRTRPTAELAETVVVFALCETGLFIAILTGHLWTLAVVILIPQRIGIILMSWWFDWLPHHGLEETPNSNRYRATRNRVGMEWLFTPLLLSQNYHLAHHLDPSVPFYRYSNTWRRNEAAYLERGAALATVFGRQLNADEFRQWKVLNRRLRRLLPMRMPVRPSASHAVLHRIPVTSVHKITADSTLVTFAVPEALRDEFRFEPGQHVAVRTDLGGKGVRRNYSICAPATQAQLRIAIKHIPGGTFSTYVATELKAGDVLELMTPTGRFGTPIHPLQQKHYVGLVAGSGITPVLSILATVLEIETESRFTLIYGNQTKESTMFRAELNWLESRYSDRLEILHVLSKDPLHTPELCGRIDGDKLDRWLSTSLRPGTVDEWFVCGPVEMATMARDTLTNHGVGPERIRLELFFGYDSAAPPRRGYPGASVTFTLSGRKASFDLAAGDSILDGALKTRSDAPYACKGGACGTCRAKLVEGTVEMAQNFALGHNDLSAGYILTCQANPTSPSVSVDYDG